MGPGRFGTAGTLAVQPLPQETTPHSAPLQLAAEQGVIGAALLVAVFGWVLYALWRSRRPTPVVLTAGGGADRCGGSRVGRQRAELHRRVGGGRGC
ncbi:hypothetical protein GCM10020256_69680 [Streptomyces thermocoprophilus]